MDFKKIFAYVFVLGFLLAPAVHADSDGNSSSEYSDAFQKRHGRMEKKIQEIYNQLSLTDEQKTQLENNKQKNREKRKALFTKIRSYKDALNKELMKTNVDMNKVNDIQSQFKALQSQMTDERLNSILEVRRILTPDQFTKFVLLMEQHKREEASEEEK